MVEKMLSRSVRLIFAGSMIMGVSTAFAQDATVQRVEITGSSIKRIASEGALPVQTLSKAQIEQSGATTVADLIASLPSMQGFTTPSTSINGGGGGTQTASIHAIGEKYTLVLLNGRRVAPFGSDSTVNLAGIPLAAVERVEILTDGASALYGSDAIAGVVNFILKKNQQDFNVEFTYSTPQESPKGKTTNVAISKGFGDYNTDGYNVLLAYSHDEQKELEASDRSFSAPGGVHPFTEGGKKYSLYLLSSNSIPGNANISRSDGDAVRFNPYLAMNGNCPAANTTVVGKRCLYNYGAVVELIPELKRDSFLASTNIKINDSLKLFAEGMWTKFTSTARYAPPAQPLGLDINSALFKNYVVPAYTKLGYDPSKITSGTMTLRLADAGGRTDAWKTEAKHLAFGAEGSVAGWDYTATFTHSENISTDTAVAGYTSREKLNAIIANGTWNPFLPPSAATKAALAPAVLHEVLDQTTAKIDVLNLRGSTELFKLDGGSAQLGVGADIMKQTYKDEPSPIALGKHPVLQPNYPDANVGGGWGVLPIDASRKSWGTFAELYMPVTKQLDLTAAVRYDNYDAIHNDKKMDSLANVLPPGTQGNKQNASTYKLAAAFRPMDSVLLRASYGTGFKAPSMIDVSEPLSNGGSSNFYDCPITSGPLLPLCNGNAEYDLLNIGNSATGSAGLKPEKSKQYTVGLRVEPMKALSLGFDLWQVKVTDQIKRLPQNIVFNNPGAYPDLFISYYHPIQEQDVLFTILKKQNIGQANYKGIDWDHTYSTATDFGKVSVNWTGTYMLTADQDVPGSKTEKSVGRFNAYNDVVFKIISKLTATWKPSDRYTHSISYNYHSGYRDAPVTVADGTVVAIENDGSVGDDSAVSRSVKAYYTLDLQSKVKLSKNFTITGGIKNLLNQDPPLSIRTAGGGNQLGFDGRYTDPLGRQFYVVGNLKF